MAFSLKGATQGASKGASAGSVGGGWGAAIGGIGGALIGGLFGKKQNESSSALQYQYNLALQKQAQEWNEYMSNTAYQRGKQDLLKAGYNPLLAVTQGGASSPTSSINSVGRGNEAEITQQAIANGITNALNWQLTKAQIEKVNAETDQIYGNWKTLFGNFVKDKIGNVNAFINETKNKFNQWKSKNFGTGALKGYVQRDEVFDPTQQYIDIDDFDKYIRAKYQTHKVDKLKRKR